MPTKVHLDKVFVFPVVMYGCESWAIKKAEWWRIDAFELCCWRRFLRVPWSARRFNKSILKEISSEYSLEGLMLKLKLQYFGHLMQRTDSLEKTLMLGKIEGRRRGHRGWDGWMASPIRTWVWAGSRSWWWKPGVLQSRGLQSWTQLSDWTELNWGCGEQNEEQESANKRYRVSFWADENVLKLTGWWLRNFEYTKNYWNEMVTHSSILAWRIPWTEKPGRLQSTGWQRVGHDWVTSLSLSL